MADEITTTSLLAMGAPGSLVGLLWLGSVMLKKFRVDKEDVKQIERATELVKSQNETINTLRDQIKAQNDRSDELTERNDRMAKERNDALIENATLKAQLNHLTENYAQASHALRNANQKIEILLSQGQVSKLTDTTVRPKKKPAAPDE